MSHPLLIRDIGRLDALAVTIAAAWSLSASAPVCSTQKALPAQPRKDAPQVVERITDRLYRVGGAMVDTAARTVTCSGEINMDSGSIEYLAVTPHGKTHESLLRLNVRPLHLQIGLLLLGLDPVNVLDAQGDLATPKGAQIGIDVHWRDANGVERSVAASSLVVDSRNKKQMATDGWVFTGSRIVRQGLEADLDGSIIAVWHDPAALVDNARPGGGNNGWIVNSQAVPKAGTSVQIVFKSEAAHAGK